MGVTPSSAYLWMKAKAAAPAPSTPVFARVVPSIPQTTSAGTGMVLEVGGVRLHLREDFDAALLRRVVAALSGVP